MDYSDIERLDRDTKGSIPTPTKIIIMLVTTVCAFVSSLSPASLIGILCIGMAAGGCSYLLRVQKMYLSLLCVPVSAVLSWIVFGNIESAVAACAFILPAIGILAARKMNAGRAKAALFGAVLLGIGAAAYFALILRQYCGSVGKEAFNSFIDGMFEAVDEDFAALGVTEEVAQTFTSYFKVLLPSVIGVMLLAASYVSGACYGFFCRLTGCTEEPGDWKLQLSAVSAVFYILIFAAAAILSCIEQNALFFGLTNAEVILAPGFVIIGIGAYKDFLKKRREEGKKNLLPIIFSVLLILFNIYGFAAMLAFIGAVNIIIKELTKLSDRS